MTALAPTVPLLHGAAMPQLGLGTWPMDDAQAESTVAAAVGMGYRLVDTAEAYGNERGVGAGLRASGVPRGELFVTTKFNVRWQGPTWSPTPSTPAVTDSGSTRSTSC